MAENYLAMLPTGVLEQITAALGNSRHADFYRAEAEFWRGEAQWWPMSVRHVHPVLALRSRPWLLWGALSAALAVAAI